MRGEELFTKKALVASFPLAQRLLYPNKAYPASHEDFKVLDDLKKQFILLTDQVKAFKMRSGNLQLFTLEPNEITKSLSFFQSQCCSHVIDMVQERVVHFGLLPEIPNQPTPQWPQYTLNAPHEDLENTFLVCLNGNKLELAAMTTNWSIPRDVASYFNEQRMKTLQQALDFDTWFFIIYFSSNDDEIESERVFPPKLLAARHRWSGVLAHPELLQSMATKAGFCS